MEHKKVETKLDVCERLAKYLIKWEKRRKKILPIVYEKIEKKGKSTFTQTEKVVMSELWYEFGPCAAKIIVFISFYKKLRLDSKKYPYLCQYLYTHKFYPPLNFTFKLKKKK